MKSWLLYIYLAALGSLVTYAVQELFYTESLMQATFAGQLSVERITHMATLSKKWQWIGYVAVPLVVLIRVFYTSLCIYSGLFYFNRTTGFGQIFKIALMADFIFLISGLAKLIILLFFREVKTIHDLHFQPFSVLEFLPRESVDTMFVYPLSLLNLFEMGYFLALAWLIRDLLSKEPTEKPLGFGKAFRLTGISYGSGLLLWVLAVLFINLNIS